MNVSFKGVKNVGSYFFEQKEAKPIVYENQRYIVPKGRYMNLYAELTNTDGNDLDEFKPVLKAFPNKNNKNAVNISYNYFINPDNGKKIKIYTINDNILEMNDITFKVFNSIFKLTKKIAEMPREKLTVDNSFLRTPEAMDAFYSYSLNKEEKICDIVDKAFTRDYAQTGAAMLCKRFEKALIKYIYS
mgnify:CR=1 FL=1